MQDTRLNQIAALTDDARCLTTELCDELPTTRAERITLTAVRQQLNMVLATINELRGDAS